jgi:predicted alpha/beta-fold hydrolase
MQYQAPWWLPGGNLQTIWSALCARPSQGGPIAYRRERWTTPDGDFVDADWLDAPVAPPAGNDTPLLVMFHGLEGSSRSGYALAFADLARERGMRFVVPHFRGCSGEMNLAPRAYHSGDHEEIGWILARLRAQHTGPLWAVGVSLGGNALMQWAAQAGDMAARSVDAAACVCSPLDLAAGGAAIGRGFGHLRAALGRTIGGDVVDALGVTARAAGVARTEAEQQRRRNHGSRDRDHAPGVHAS